MDAAAREPSRDTSTMSKFGHVLWQAAVIGLQVCFLLSAWGALLSFQAWSASSMIATWTWAYDDDDLWERFRHLLDVPYYMQPDQTVLAGWDSLNMILYNFAAVVCIFCFSVFTMFPTDLPLHRPIKRAVDAVWSPVRRVLQWQLPFRRFWLRWCSGLSLAEALLWSIWFVVHIVGAWDITRYMTTPKFTGWDMVGMSYYVPKSVLRMESISIAISWIIYINTAILFFPVAHSSFLNRMLGLPYAALVRFHRWIGHFVLWTTLLHGVFFYALWAADPTINFWTHFFDWSKEYGIVSFAGTIALGFGLVLWATSVDYVRRTFYKLFYYSHIICFIGYLVFALIHYYWGWFGLFPSLFLFAADLVVRSYYAQMGCYITSFELSDDGQVAKVSIAMEPNTFQDVRQLAGAHVFIKVPAVSRLDYHPFTIMAAAKDPVSGVPVITMAIKKYDRWSKDLLTLLATTHNALPVRVWRPFDQPPCVEHWQKYGGIVMVAGGIAVTPIVAIINDLLDARARGHNVPAKVLVLFAARTRSEFSALDERILHEATADSKWLDLRMFYTGSTCVCSSGRALEAKGNEGGFVKGDPAAKEAVASSTSRSNSADVAVIPPLELGKERPSSDGSTSDPQPSTAFGKASKACWSFARSFFPVDFLTDRQFVWVTVLAYFGGFMGIIMAQAAAVEILGMNDYWYDGYWRCGLITVSVVCIQGLGLPALFVLLPAYCCRLWRWWRGDKPTPVFAGSSAFPTVYKVESQKLVARESGLAFTVQQGRPNVGAVVAAFAEDIRSSGGRVAVVSGGPEPLMAAVSLAVSQLNDNLCAPGVELHQVAHNL